MIPNKYHIKVAPLQILIKISWTEMTALPLHFLSFEDSLQQHSSREFWYVISFPTDLGTTKRKKKFGNHDEMEDPYWEFNVHHYPQP